MTQEKLIKLLRPYRDKNDRQKFIDLNVGPYVISRFWTGHHTTQQNIQIIIEYYAKKLEKRLDYLKKRDGQLQKDFDKTTNDLNKLLK